MLDHCRWTKASRYITQRCEHCHKIVPAGEPWYAITQTAGNGFCFDCGQHTAKVVEIKRLAADKLLKGVLA